MLGWGSNSVTEADPVPRNDDDDTLSDEKRFVRLNFDPCSSFITSDDVVDCWWWLLYLLCCPVLGMETIGFVRVGTKENAWLVVANVAMAIDT